MGKLEGLVGSQRRDKATIILVASISTLPYSTGVAKVAGKSSLVYVPHALLFLPLGTKKCTLKINWRLKYSNRAFAHYNRPIDV